MFSANRMRKITYKALMQDLSVGALNEYQRIKKEIIQAAERGIPEVNVYNKASIGSKDMDAIKFLLKLDGFDISEYKIVVSGYSLPRQIIFTISW